MSTGQAMAGSLRPIVATRVSRPPGGRDPAIRLRAGL